MIMSSSSHSQSEETTVADASVKAYPSPEAEYQDVVEDASLFSEKLRRFHSSFNTTLTFPDVGGRILDLHRLFTQVTSRGGLEKVISERKWKEVVLDFDFPSTVKNTSFALRKYYVSLLYHFEQAYFFRKTMPPLSLASTVPLGESAVTGSAADNESTSSFNTQTSRTLQTGISLVGAIEQKCDNGYIVSVNLGSEQLKGILYHIPSGSMSQSSCSSDTSATPNRVRRRYRMRLKDPSRPKPNRSGYTFFFAEQYTKLRPAFRGQERAISKKIGSMWSELSEGEKQVYQDKGIRDKERYRAEMLEYKMCHNQ